MSGGLKPTRGALTRRSTPIPVALPEQGDRQRFDRLALTARDLGDNKAAYVDEIWKLAADMATRVVAIGRYLNMAKEKLPHGAYEAMIANELPFKKTQSWLFRKIAEAVDTQRLAEQDLPRDINAAAKLACLDDETLAQARSHQPPLVRSDARREEIVRFIRSLRSQQQAKRPRRELFLEEAQALKEEDRKLSERRKEIKARLVEIDEELNSRVIDGQAVEIAA
jgi:hypothetical protein